MTKIAAYRVWAAILATLKTTALEEIGTI